jgi:hypothetical protein
MDYSLMGKLGAAKLHASGKTNTGPARAAADARYDRMVDPDGILDPKERAKRAAHARREHLLRMSLRAAAIRRQRRMAGQGK